MRGTSTGDRERYRANLQDEVDGAALYEAMADLEKDPKLAEIYRRLAAGERRHAEMWAERLRALDGVPDLRPSWRTRVLIWLARRFGVNAILPTVIGLEDTGIEDYRHQTEAVGIIGEERSHATVLREITRTTRGGLAGSAVAQLEGRHRAGGGNALRAAVLGANDGLLSNLSLVMGVAGAQLSSQSILVTGISGLLAGASSMALGEWISVQSSRELYQKQIATEREEIEAVPEEELEELVLIYQARGLSEARAREIATEIMRSPANALDTLAREELGINPEDLGGSAYVAGGTSFGLFAVGAVIPVIAFIFLSGTVAVAVSIAMSVLGLFGVGAAITLFTGRSALLSGARQVVFGLAAAAITFVVGRLVGVTLTG
jgi:VIT1/CCC1 family predicted Fe2+/Mn2+ transporter/bacterioferritin (cytochrome b1)